MRDEKWSTLDDEALERLLIERWLYRGVLLAVMFLAAVVVTWIGVRGPGGLADQVTLGGALLVALAAGAVGFTMRLQDIRIHRELRRRRAARPDP